LHQFHGRVEIVSAKVVAGVDSGDGRTLFVVLAFISESRVFERSAFLGNKMAIFSKITMENAKAA